MSEIVTAVLTQTVGLIVNKGRDVVAEKLEGGDVTDETIRRWIVREISTVTSKLNALIRKDLNTSIFHFRTGLTYLFDVLNKTRSYSIPMQAAAGSEELSNEERLRSHSGPVAVNIIETLDAWKKSIVLDDEDKRALSNAKEGFRQAALYASEAFSIENLETSDCLKARAIFVAAKILENVDHPKDAVTACKTCLEDLHDMSSVKNNFKVALKNGFWRARFQKKDRRQIISSVCHVNRVIHDVMQTVCVTIDQEKHCVDIGKETLVDTLRDVRVIQTLLKTEIGHCCVTPRELGEEGEDPERTLTMPQGIATDGQGRFIVGDNDDHNVKLKVFDRSGSFLRSICLQPACHKDTQLSIRDIATDNEGNIYVLGKVKKTTGSPCYTVYVFDTSFNVNHTFSVKASRGSTMTINDNNKVMILSSYSGQWNVCVYETDGQFVRSFGEGMLKEASSITAANDGRVVLLDKDGCQAYVQVFSEHGGHLRQIKVESFYSSLNIAFYQSSKQNIVVAGKENIGKNRLHMLIYTVTGKLARSIHLDGKGIDYLSRITVSKEGRFAVVFRESQGSTKVLVV